MKLLKPSWVHHDDKPIFSVDVHQECHKFATGGQGGDSGRVVIWNLLPVLSEKAELDDSVPKMLCQMDNHLSCVNCVRWSQNGHMLASGSDDKLVMIWRIAKGSSGVFGTGGIQQNAENWKCSATLRGHSGDVLDLAWSPQDRWLASCSIDNTIIVWDIAGGQGAIVAMLKGHTGLVKGVAWDPVGKFLASQSDDRSLKIWKTSDWTCSSTITEPFEECGGTTHILRLSWSPDGQYLVSAHAMNGGGPTAQIIEREGWKCDKDFVGHRKAVTCVRFHNSILKRQTAKSSKPQQYCCLAVGSRDRSLSVWMTALQRPLVVIHELFNDSILDLSWGPSKCILMACSGDGTVACLQFSEAELGQPLSEEDKNSLYQRIYGKVTTLENGASTTNDMLIECAELLHTAQGKAQPPTLPIVTTNHNNNFINSTMPANNHCQAPLAASAARANGEVAALAATSINKQLETRTADGKRRITPVFIPANQDASEPQPLGTLSSSSRSLADATSLLSGGICEVNPSATGTAVVMDRQEDLCASLGKGHITAVEENRLDSRLIKCSNASPKANQPKQVNRDAIRTFPLAGSTSATTTGIGLSLSEPYQASTTGPKINITLSTVCEFQKTALEHRVHVHNGHVRTTAGLLAKVTAFRFHMGAEKLWEVFVGSPIVNLNFCRRYVMLCSLDGTMRLLNMQNGTAVLPVVALTTAATQCAFCPLGRLVGVITDSGLLRIWDIAEERVTLATTCAEVFGKFGAVLQFHITEHGVPLVLFANGHAYSYSQNLQSWLVLNTKDPFMRHGLQTTMPKGFQRDHRLYPITSLQAMTSNFNASNYNSIELNSSSWQAAAKVNFIENQIKLCRAIDSPVELQHWYSMLTYHLAVSGTESRLRLLLNDLLEPVRGVVKRNAGKEQLAPKLELLELVLGVLKTHIKWQRLYMEYNELYEESKNALQGQKPFATTSATSSTFCKQHPEDHVMDTTA